MPYASSEKRREYQLNWILKNRNSWFEGKWCVRCGSKEDMELDHIDSTKKVSHRIWSWSLKRRLVELAKCQVLCKKCHAKKSEENLDGQYKVSIADVERIRTIYETGTSSLSQIGDMFGIVKQQVHRIVRNLSRSSSG